MLSTGFESPLVCNFGPSSPEPACPGAGGAVYISLGLWWSEAQHSGHNSLGQGWGRASPDVQCQPRR